MGRTPSPPRRMRRSKSRDRERVDRDRNDRDRDRDRRRRRDREDRSRERDRRRRSPERDHDRRRDDRRRSWSRSRSRSNERHRRSNFMPSRPAVTEADLKGKTEEEQEMLKTMGFCSFDTTKGKKIEDNEEGAVHVILKRKYRQYMNRKGGFNRPLDFVA